MTFRSLRILPLLLVLAGSPTAGSAEVFHVVAGAEVEISGGEQVCFTLVPDRAAEVELEVQLRFTSWVPDGWVEVDGVPGRDFRDPLETIAFRVEPEGVHRLRLVLQEPAAVDRLLISSDRAKVVEAPCRLYEDRTAQRVVAAPEPVNRLGRPDADPVPAGPPPEPSPRESAPPDPARPDQPVFLRAAAGTQLPLVLEKELSSRDSHAGERFTAELAEPLLLGGREFLPAGSRVEGRVAEARNAGRFGNSLLRLSFDRVRTPDGRQAPLSGTLQEVGPGSKGKQGRIIGGSALGGAVLGQVLGGDSESTFWGAVLGGAIAAGTIAAEPGDPVVLPAGTGLTLNLDQPLELPASR